MTRAFAGQYYHIGTEASEFRGVLDVRGGSVDSGAPVQQFVFNNTDAQLFAIFPVDGDRFVIANRNSGLVLDVEGGRPDAGTGIQQFEFNGTLAQMFEFEPRSGNLARVENGGLTGIRTLLAGNMVFDVAGASPDSEARIQQWHRNGTIAQNFILVNGGGLYRMPDAPRPDRQVTPQLTSRSQPTEATPFRVVGSSLIPYFLVNDSQYDHRRAVRESPYYLLIRETSFALVNGGFSNNTSSAESSFSVSVTSGFSRETTREFGATVGFSVTTSAGGGFGAFSASVETTVSTELSFSFSTTNAMFQESTVEHSATVPPNTAVAIFVPTERFTLRRADGSQVGSWSGMQPTAVISQFPN